MSKVNDGGPAFPLSEHNALNPVTNMSGDDISSGMSLRDWFAGQALAGICAHDETWGLSTTKIAAAAYECADAMLAARTLSEGE